MDLWGAGQALVLTLPLSPCLFLGLRQPSVVVKVRRAHAMVDGREEEEVLVVVTSSSRHASEDD